MFGVDEEPKNGKKETGEGEGEGEGIMNFHSVFNHLLINTRRST